MIMVVVNTFISLPYQLNKLQLCEPVHMSLCVAIFFFFFLTVIQ